MNNNEKILRLNEMIKESNSIVFFGGAGVSTESGIPDFRSKDGLYNMKYKYPPERILSHAFFINNTEYMPNITHYTLAKLEEKGKLKSIITQNIDGLHQKAGSKHVLELHGSVLRNFCTRCNKFYSAEYVFNYNGNIPKCNCGGIIKPDVVLYEEPLDESIYSQAIKDISSCDMLIIGGTSLVVYPASYLIQYFKGKYIVLINKEKTPFDSRATLVINDSIGNVFKNIKIEDN